MILPTCPDIIYDVLCVKQLSVLMFYYTKLYQCRTEFYENEVVSELVQWHFDADILLYEYSKNTSSHYHHYQTFESV